MNSLTEARPDLISALTTIEGEKPQIAVFGASGKMGSHIIKHLGGEYWEIYAVTHATQLPPHASDKTHETIPAVDITDAEQVAQVIKRLADAGVRTIVNAVGDLSVDQEEATREDKNSRMYKVNVIGAKNIASACEKYEVGLMTTGTEYEFSGKKRYGRTYPESYVPNQTNTNPTWYGQTKAQASVETQKLYPEGVWIRLSQVQHTMGCLFTATLKELEKGKLFTRSGDQYIAPISDATMAAALLFIERMLRTEELADQRILHVSATTQSTVYECCLRLALQYGLEKEAIERISAVPLRHLVDSGVQKVVRPKNAILGIEKTQQLLPGILKPMQDEIQIYQRTYPRS